MKPTYNKALELMKHYYTVVYPYVGSDFMTGTESQSVKFNGAKRESLFLAQNLLDVLPSNAPEVYQTMEMMEIIRGFEYNDHIIKYLEE